MSISHTHVHSWQEAGGAQLVYTATYTDDGEINDDIPVAAGATNTPAALTLPLAQVTALMIASDQDVTLKTNSTTTPGATIALKASKPLFWVSGNGYYTNPLVADVTSLFLSNAGTTAATVKLRILTHPA